jgi:hypothetical protein
MYLAACNFIPTARAQSPSRPVLTDEEKQEAQQLSVTFAKRLGQTLDFGAVMSELFAPDAVERYLANQKRDAAGNKPRKVMLHAGVFLDGNLLENAGVADWQRLYVATNSFFTLGLAHAYARNTNFEDIRPGDLYPREVIKLLDANPLLRNLIQKKTEERVLKSSSEMRSAAATLEQANVIMRTAMPRGIDLENAALQMVMHTMSKTRPLSDKELEDARAEMMRPQLEIAESDYFGFPKGTRIISIATFSLHQLVLVRVSGKLRVVWAYPLAE